MNWYVKIERRKDKSWRSTKPLFYSEMCILFQINKSIQIKYIWQILMTLDLNLNNSSRDSTAH